MEMKEFDNALMDLAYEFRQSREMSQKVTRSYPEHVRMVGDALENSMRHTDFIVTEMRVMLRESRLALQKTYYAVDEKVPQQGKEPS